MSQSILQTYLNEQHIKTDVQDNIDGLKKAVKEVTTYLTRKKIRSDIIPFALAALDPKIKDGDPVVQQVENIIIKKWPAFKNGVAATKDKSTTYVRAVILESLNQLSKDDAATAALVWLTARDVVGHYQLDAEESVISGFLQNLADRVEESGQAEWGVGHKVQAKTLEGIEVSIPAAKAAQIDEESLKVHLLDAMVHSGWNQQAGGGKNPHSQAQNNVNWPKFMAEHSAMGITQIVNAALLHQAKSLSSISSSIQKSLNDYFEKLQPFFEDLNDSIFDGITASKKRSQVLWWKQSLYSHSLNASYRSLDQLSAAVCMAHDLAAQVEPIYPESLDYLLREALKDVHGNQTGEKRPLIDWLKDSFGFHQNIQPLLKEYAEHGGGRKPLLNAWANALSSGETTTFFTETGIQENAELTVSDLAVWLFHGLQAKKLANNE